MTNKVQSIRGMNDLLPSETDLWQHIEAAIRSVCAQFGYQEIRLPIIERTELFKRSIGEQTDIVEKEMYTFADNRGDSLTLRPEATASCIRAAIEHGLIQRNKARLWYMGPMFRYERPQKGRYRQFHQFGIEAFGWKTPDLDTEIILVAHALWQQLKIAAATRLEINSIGTPESRKQYRGDLVAYFEKHKSSLDEDSLRRLLTNPLRILDSKNPQMQTIIEGAPVMIDYLSEQSRTRFDRLQTLLSSQGIEFTINNRLVRGLDYYTDTVFEWTTDLLGAQNAICGGGRYDGLVALLGGGEIPGAGFAMGLERLIEVMRQSNLPFESVNPQVYLCTLGDAAELEGLSLAQNLRAAGVRTMMHCGGGKLAQQLKSADRANASLGVIIGANEIHTRTALVKALRTDVGQQSIAFGNLVETISNLLAQPK